MKGSVMKIKLFGKRVIPASIVDAKAKLISLKKRLDSKGYITQILEKEKPIHLELGAGKKKGSQGWKTLDIDDVCDIYWDLRDGIPFPDQSIHKIYSSHLFEHLTFQQGKMLLKECSRVLVPGGHFSICVPNAKLYIEAYVNGIVLDEEHFFKPAFNGVSPIDYVNYMAYMNGEHKYMFDKENLISILGSNGFKDAKLREFDSSLDRLERDFESIYAEAHKA
jgi:predicted SAM-dependent methyltransferase